MEEVIEELKVQLANSQEELCGKGQDMEKFESLTRRAIAETAEAK